MNPKIIISFFAGSIAGAGGSFFFIKKYLEKKHREEIEEVRAWAHDCKKYANEMKEYAEEMYKSITGEDIEAVIELGDANEKAFLEKFTGELLKKEEKDQNPIDNIIEQYDSIEQALEKSMKDDYEKDSSYLDSLVDYTQYSKNVENSEHPSESIGVPAFELITALEYDNSKPLNDKIILNYYAGDDVLCYEETGEYIRYPDEVIGSEALHAFGSPDYEDPDEVFVRDNRSSKDYQIIMYEGNYQDEYGDLI